MYPTLKNFIVPLAHSAAPKKVVEPNVSAVVPTYKPGATAFRLVKSLLEYNPKLSIVVVDDSTPVGHDGMQVLEDIRALSSRITVLRTPQNKLKAGALNLGLRHLLEQKGPQSPAVVLTLDDDVVIGHNTVQKLVQALLSDPGLGAVCSRCSALNKGQNLLTRLQGLEYVGFNAIRLSDQGFMRGPLVMHGMLTAFRARALRQAGHFAEGHLIEDYEMTTRLKTLGWRVRAALEAEAWTEVPDTIGAFWRQRTRWSFGGVLVVLQAKDKRAVLQDVLGHSVFIATLALIVLLLVIGGVGSVPAWVARAVTVLSLVQFAAWYGLQLWLMRWYKEKDAWDWLLRAVIIPEMLYSAIMTLVVLGSYAYLLVGAVLSHVARWGTWGKRLATIVNSAFAIMGYSGTWGTRTNS